MDFLIDSYMMDLSMEMAWKCSQQCTIVPLTVIILFLVLCELRTTITKPFHRKKLNPYKKKVKIIRSSLMGRRIPARTTKIREPRVIWISKNYRTFWWTSCWRIVQEPVVKWKKNVVTLYKETHRSSNRSKQNCSVSCLDGDEEEIKLYTTLQMQIVAIHESWCAWTYGLLFSFQRNAVNVYKAWVTA